MESLAGGLQKPFKGDLEEQPGRKDRHHLQIIRAEPVDLTAGLGVGQVSEIQTAAEKAQKKEGNVGQKNDEQSVGGCSVYPVGALFAQGTGKIAVDANAGAGGKGDHQILHGKG